MKVVSDITQNVMSDITWPEMVELYYFNISKPCEQRCATFSTEQGMPKTTEFEIPNKLLKIKSTKLKAEVKWCWIAI